jgi:UrcA family protein
METRNNLRKIALLAGAALLSTSAMAGPLKSGVVTRTETVKYSLPKATTMEGAAALYQKLNEAAARVCSEGDGKTAWMYTVDSLESCISNALDKAVQHVGMPMVTALHQQNAADARLARSGKEVSRKPETIASR